MTTMAQWVKQRPMKKLSFLASDRALHRIKLQMKSSSSLLFVMVMVWIVGCLQELLIWGKLSKFKTSCRYPFVCNQITQY